VDGFGELPNGYASQRETLHVYEINTKERCEILDIGPTIASISAMAHNSMIVVTSTVTTSYSPFPVVRIFSRRRGHCL